MEVKAKGQVIINKLESTQEYTISVRNISRELNIISSEASLKQLTRKSLGSYLLGINRSLQ